ncbi:MAG: hypothetical protein AAB368_06835, partial [bacterium]
MPVAPLAQPVAWGAFRDEGILLGVLGVIFVLELLRPRGSRTFAGWLLLVGAVAGAWLAWARPVVESSLWGGVFVVDPLSRYAKGLFLIALAVAAAASLDHMARREGEGEYYVVLGTSALGMMLLSSAGELVSLFVA